MINKPILSIKSFKNTCSSFETFYKYIEWGFLPSKEYILQDNFLNGDKNLADIMDSLGNGSSVGNKLRAAVATEMKTLTDASFANNLAEIEKLVDLYPTLVNKRIDTSNRDTLLMKAVRNNSLEIVNFLISRGALLNLQNSSLQTALYIASSTNKPHIVKALLEAGADQFISQVSNILPLESAITDTERRFVPLYSEVVDVFKAYNEQLINKPILNTKSFRNTYRSFETFIQYINWGFVPSSADLNNTNLNRSLRSLLYGAICQVNIEAVTKLLDLGARTTIRNTAYDTSSFDGYTARSFANYFGNKEIKDLVNSRP